MPFWSRKKSDNPSSGLSTPKSSTQGVDPSNLNLRLQFPIYASTSTKIRLSLLATAMVDALGGPAEFSTRGEHEFVTTLLPNKNFNLPPGVWTDDTSMMLCLANSISTYEARPDGQVGGFDEVDQLITYRRWYREGHLSAIGRCFDIGGTIQRAIGIFESTNDPQEALRRIQSDLSRDSCCGNGSLMRVLPIGLAYWRDDNIRKFYSQKSSEVTHPNKLCVEVCEMWTGAISLILEEMNAPPRSPSGDDARFSKLSLLDYFADYSYTQDKLRDLLGTPFGLPPRPEDRQERERWYIQYHPLMKNINETQTQLYTKERSFPYDIPPQNRLPSSGYVLHTAVAALYCFFATRTFEEGAIMAVNLCDDADTVGAVYAGLAAVWYAAEEGKADRIFWTKRVREWRAGIVKRDLVEQVAENLVRWEQTLEDF